MTQTETCYRTASIEGLLVFGFINDLCKDIKLSSIIPNEVIDIIVQFYPNPCIVIQNGSGYMKTGFAGEKQPVSIFPSVVGKLRHPGVMVGMAQKDFYVGNEAISKRGILALRYPIEHGIITSWDHMESIWRHTFYNELSVQPEEIMVLVTEKPLNPKANREKMVQLMFETFNVQSVYIAVDSVLSLYGTGRLTGCVLHIGDGVAHTCPVYEGYYLRDAVMRLDIAGRDLTDYLMKLMTETGQRLGYYYRGDPIQTIKETLCYVALNYEEELKKYEQSNDLVRQYELPDGNVINVGNQRFRCTEPLFSPHLIGKSASGIHWMLDDSIRKCSKDIREMMYANVLLSGGSTKFPGMKERVEKELKGRVSPNKMRDSIHVIDVLNKDYLTWIGGSMLASTPMFLDLAIKRYEYDESGPGIVRRKCF